MNFDYTPKVRELQARLNAFMATRVYPNERRYRDEVEGNRAQGQPWIPTRLVEELKVERARRRAVEPLPAAIAAGRRASPISNTRRWPRSWVASPGRRRFSIAARRTPATWRRSSASARRSRSGNGSSRCCAGEIRSAFLMTEPAVASSDATNIECSMVRDGDQYVVNGRKWWSSGAGDPRCRIYIVMGKTDPGAPKHRQQSMLLVPAAAPGVRVVRALSVLNATTRRTGTWKSISPTCACR